MMRLHKQFLMWVIIIVYIIFGGIYILPIFAQPSPNFERSLEIQSSSNHSIVDTKNFPSIEVQFMLVENGKFVQEDLTQNTITILEDGYAIAPIRYYTKSLPIHFTVVVDIESVADLDSLSVETDPASNVLVEDLLGIVWQPSQGDELQLCFTLGLPYCSTKQSSDDVKLFYFDRVGVLRNQSRDILQDSSVSEPTSLSEVLKLSIIAAEKSQKIPAVVLIRIPRSDGSERSMPDISESLLEELTLKGGVFIVIDKIYLPSYQEEFTKFLSGKDAYYYHTVGPVEDRSECLTVDSCVHQQIAAVRPVYHIVEYESWLFQDDQLHELTVQIDSNLEKENSLVDTKEFSFKLTNSDSTVISSVRNLNSLLTICSPLILMLILVFSIGTSDKNNSSKF